MSESIKASGIGPAMDSTPDSTHHSAMESMIGESAARLFSQNVDRALLGQFEAGVWPQRLWQLVADNGLTLALAAEHAGGIGASWSEAYPILRGIGYWQVPLPLAETMIAALLLSRAGIDIPAGPITLIDTGDGDAFTITASVIAPAIAPATAPAIAPAIAPLHAAVNAAPDAGADAAGLRITGRAVRVAWASRCRWALAALGNGDIVLLDLLQEGAVRITPHLTPACEPSDDVDFLDARCVAHTPNPIPALKRPIRTLGAIAGSAMMVGAMEWLLEQSVQYAGDRVQFGRPIGKNQAIQQQLAQMAGDIAAARVAAIVACADAPGASPDTTPGASPDTTAGTAADEYPAAFFSAAVAKVRAGEAATRANAIAHQVHGAIGFTYEHSLHFATRRLWAWREIYGADAWWAQRLGEAAIAAGAAAFWPAMTSRRFHTGGADPMKAPE